MLENNRLIAEFLGSEIEETLKGEKVYCLLMPDENDISGFKKEFFEPSELKFHNDWNWLMMVLNKIEKTKLGSLEIQSKNLVLLQYNQKTDMYYNSTLIENVYNACVEFIKWYNENLTSQTKNETSCK